MFERVVQQLVQSIGPDIYLPSPSIASAARLAPLSLVERKTSKWWLVEDKHYPTEFSLENVLQGGPLSVEMEEEKDLVTFTNSSTLNVTASLSAQLKSFFESELKDVDNITLEANIGDLHRCEVNMQSLVDQLATRKLNMEHELIKELAGKQRRALCVVTGVVKTTAPASISSTLNVDVSGDEDVKVPTAGEEAKGEVKKDRKRALNLPVGTVLAYEVVELAVSSQGLMKVMLTRGEKGGFNLDLLDRTDSGTNTSAGIESRGSKFEGFSHLDDASRKSLVVHLLALCADPALLKQLSKVLKGAAVEDVDGKVEAVSACMAGHEGDEASTSLQLLCKLLRSLSVNQLEAMSQLAPDDLPMLSAILERTYTGSSLPYSRGKTQEFVSNGGAALHFLIAGLGYTLEKGEITPPDLCLKLLQTAFAAVSALAACCSNLENFVFE